MIRVATRGSPLALSQARLAVEALAQRHPSEDFVLQELTTRGDRARTMPLTDAPQEGVFVKVLERALRSRRAELAVHSVKDLPTTLASDLVLAAFLPRADARDVLVGRYPTTLAGLPHGAVIGTGSPRRAAQLLAARPDLQVVPMRGNVDTRLRRLREGTVDAVVLAAAGLERLDRLPEVHEWLSFEVMLPAPGQAALVLQAVAGREAAELAAVLDDPKTRRAVEAERVLLRGLGGGCLAPVGAYAFIDGRDLVLRAAVASIDGRRVLRARARGANDTEVIDSVRTALRQQGADTLISASRSAREARRAALALAERAKGAGEG